MGCLSWCGFEKKDKQPTRIINDRSCTDVAFLLAFIFGWIVLLYVFSQARASGGDPNKIVRGVDMYGRICGVSEGVKDKPYAAWPDPQYYDPKICVSKCSYTNNPNSTMMAWLYPTVLFTFYCVPSLGLDNSSISISVQGSFFSNLESKAQMMSNAVGDLWTAWNIILACAAISLLITFFFTFLLRYMASCVIWFCVAFLTVGGIVLGVTLLNASNATDASDQANRKKMLKYAAYFAFGLTGFFLLVVFSLRKEIRIAVELVKEAARAMIDMASMFFFPIVPLIATLAYFTFWVICALYIFSVSDLKPENTPTDVLTYGEGFPPNMVGLRNDNPATMQRFHTNQDFRVTAALLVFHLLWNVQFQFYFGFTVLAGAVANWYFSIRDHKGNKVHGDPEHNELPWDPVYRSLKRTLRYHVGTIALASFIIAVIEFSRLVIKYLERKMNGKGTIARCMLKFLSCFLACAECCLDKVSKNALIWTAVWGDNFFTAACSSFVLLWRNLAKVAALNAVSGILMFIGKLTVAVATMGLCGLILTNVQPWKAEIYSPIVPAIVVFMLSYVVSSMFFLIFEVAIDTTLLCFLVDSEKNKHNAQEMFASEALKHIVAKHKKESETMASEMNTTRTTKIRPEDVASPEDFQNGHYVGEPLDPLQGNQPVELNRYQ